MKYFMCRCTHTTADHAGHGLAECLIDNCLCAKMDAGEEVELKKSAPKFRSLAPLPKASDSA